MGLIHIGDFLSYYCELQTDTERRNWAKTGLEEGDAEVRLQCQEIFIQLNALAFSNNNALADRRVSVLPEINSRAFLSHPDAFSIHCERLSSAEEQFLCAVDGLHNGSSAVQTRAHHLLETLFKSKELPLAFELECFNELEQFQFRQARQQTPKEEKGNATQQIETDKNASVTVQPPSPEITASLEPAPANTEMIHGADSTEKPPERGLINEMLPLDSFKEIFSYFDIAAREPFLKVCTYWNSVMQRLYPPNYNNYATIRYAINYCHPKPKILLRELTNPYYPHLLFQDEYLQKVACDHAPENFLLQLLSKGCFNSTFKENYLLKTALRREQMNVLYVLLADDAFNPGANNHAALRYAVTENRPALVKLLLAHPRIDPNYSNGHALQYAVAHDLREITFMLLPHPHTNPFLDGNRILETACAQKNFECVRYLLSHSSMKVDSLPPSILQKLAEELLQLQRPWSYRDISFTIQFQTFEFILYLLTTCPHQLDVDTVIQKLEGRIDKLNDISKPPQREQLSSLTKMLSEIKEKIKSEK